MMNHMQAVAFMKQVYLYTMKLFLKHRIFYFISPCISVDNLHGQVPLVDGVPCVTISNRDSL